MERHEDDVRTVLFGQGAEAALAAELARRGARRVLLLSSPGRPEGALRLQALLGERAAGVLSIAEPQVPLAVAEQARAEARRLDADWVLAHGGGTAVGLAKAVALSGDVQVAAVATTYAGSEMTEIYGITADGAKTTGRDPRVRPVLVAYDPALTTGLPVPLSLASGLNALAHSIEALYATDATDAAREAAARSAALLLDGLEAVVADPTSLSARADVLRGAWQAGVALDGASMALHHKLAHVLGGSFGLPHARTHAALLPYTLAHNAVDSVLDVLSRAWRTEDPLQLLHAWCERHGVTVRLSELDLPHDALVQVVKGALEKQYPNPVPVTEESLGDLLEDAWHGRRPRLHARRLRIGQGQHAATTATLVGDLATARAAVLAVHGRGALAEALLDTLGGHADVAWLAPQAVTRSWYPKGFRAPVVDNQPWFHDALATLDAAWAALRAHLPAERIVVVGFSQGACLVQTWLSHSGAKPGGVLGLIGAPTPGFTALPDLAGTRVWLSGSEEDRWVPADDVRASAARFEAAGADVRLHLEPGDGHRITPADHAALTDILEACMGDDLDYLTGFGAALRSEARPGAVPDRQNGPRKNAYGLYAEQINGTGFTVERKLNRRVWLYRLRPQVHEVPWSAVDANPLWRSQFQTGSGNPEPLRFRPQPIPEEAHDFLAGVRTFAGAGDPALKSGMAVHLYTANTDMERAFVDLDGDLLVVPQEGELRVQTELGWLHLAPGEIGILPRGIRFRVTLPAGPARGWLAELYEGHLVLPERGLIGANGLADERHFKAPVAAFEDVAGPYTIVAKSVGAFYDTRQPYSPFDVVGWHGTYAPFKYDLMDFASMGSVRFDHPDPSVLTVLTAPHDTHGRSALDVAVFAGRWDVTEHSFRPPYFHRNSAIEFNMVIKNLAGSKGYPPGAYSYTPYLSPHGVASRTVDAINAMTDAEADRPSRGSDQSLWLQFETTYLLRMTPWAEQADNRDTAFLDNFADWTPGDAG